MSDDLYAEKLAWFKQNERPEVVLLIADNPELARIVVAWTTLQVSRGQKLTALSGDSESEVWEWLWRNARYSQAELMDKIGVSLAESGLESRMKPLIGNRILYPDGTGTPSCSATSATGFSSSLIQSQGGLQESFNNRQL